MKGGRWEVRIRGSNSRSRSRPREPVRGPERSRVPVKTDIRKESVDFVRRDKCKIRLQAMMGATTMGTSSIIHPERER